MSKREIHFSLIEFRPDPSDSKRGVEWLGIALEFTTPSHWIVGLAMRAILDSDLSKLDPMSRELLEKRSDVMEAEIKQILPRASQTGDVLRLLAANNRWSVHVTEPRTREIKDDSAAKDHSIELEFDKEIDGEAMIVADGWIEYPYSQTMFAAWQAGVSYKAVSVEAMGQEGKWVMLLDQVGYPAGMSREMVIPLLKDRLPKGCRKIRLSTNQEIYWDRIFVAFPEVCRGAKRVVMPLVRANLVQSGFAQRKEGRRPDYEYAKRIPLWDTRAQEGWYTRFGDVKELVESVDDAVAIFGPGEEVEMEFEAPPGEGVFVLEVSGWCKDKDMLTKDGQTVGPVPARENSSAEILRRRDEKHRRFNTRYQSGG